jgi:peptidoglycan/xylan/chitin deacetylase (PgdA/CDA1 family)
MEPHGENRQALVMSRRLFTLATVAVTLGSCSDAGQSGGNGSKPATLPDAPATATSSGQAPASPAPTPKPTQPPAVPGKDRIVAEFKGKMPREWGLHLPGVAENLAAGSRGIALTFDCCGGPGGDGVDRALIDTLRLTGTRATFFLNFRWIQAHPALAKSLADNPLFEIGNHGTRHVPLSVSGRSAYGMAGTASLAEVYDEVMVNQIALRRLTGVPARYFRPGTAYFDDVSVAVVRKLGLIPVSFSINGDGGATYPAPVVYSAITAANAGDIVIAHANQAQGGTAAGVAGALPALKASGLKPGWLNLA